MSKELEVYKVVEKWRKPLRWGISIEDVDKFLNYEDVKHWFYVNGYIDNWFYIAIYDNLIVGYYFRNIKKGGRVEILPDYRRNGKYGHLNVYRRLLERIIDKYPKDFYSTVSLLNIPSLSTHFKNGFDIEDIKYYENKRKHFLMDLVAKVVLGKDFKKEPIKNRKIDLNLYYEYNNQCYKYNSESNYNKIKDIFINHNRDIKCFVINRNGKIIYLEREGNDFVYPDNYMVMYNLYDAKYKLIIPKKGFFVKTKEEIKKRILHQTRKIESMHI